MNISIRWISRMKWIASEYIYVRLEFWDHRQIVIDFHSFCITIGVSCTNISQVVYNTDQMSSHAENRLHVCLVCMRIETYQWKISPPYTQICIRWIWPWWWEIACCCGTCRAYVTKKEKGMNVKEIEIFYHSLLGNVPPTTRYTTSAGCMCKICEIARQTITSQTCSSSKYRLSGKPDRLCSKCLSVIGRRITPCL